MFGIVLWVGCTSDKSPMTKDEILNIAITKSPEAINPILHYSGIAREVYQYIHLPLADLDPETYELTPILLEALPTQKKLTAGDYRGMTAFEMKIRPEASWDDGTPITGYDYAFTLKCILHPNILSRFSSYLQDVQAVIIDEENPKHFSVVISDEDLLTEEVLSTLIVYPQYAYQYAENFQKIPLATLVDTTIWTTQQKKDLQAFALDFTTDLKNKNKVVGSGPYRYEEWTDNNTIILQRKEDYWGDTSPNFALQNMPKSIEVSIVSDEASILSLLEQGNIDVTKSLGAELFNTLMESDNANEKYNFQLPETLSLYYLALNNQHPILASNTVRKALRCATDVDHLINALERGHGTPATGIIHPSKSYYNTEINATKFDLSKADSLLNLAGWQNKNSDGIRIKNVDGDVQKLSLEYYITGSKFSQAIALILKEDYAKIGVDIQIITKPFARIRREHLQKRAYGMTVLALPLPLSQDDPYGKWHSDNDTPTGANWPGYRSEVADSLISIIHESDEARIPKEVFIQLQQVMAEDVPCIFLYNPVERIVISRRWKGSSTSRRPGYLANTFVPQ